MCLLLMGYSSINFYQNEEELENQNILNNNNDNYNNDTEDGSLHGIILQILYSK